MFLPKDLSSRFEVLRRKRKTGFETATDPILRGWAYMLLLLAVAVIVVTGISAYRLIYWSEIDDRLLEAGDASAYDETKLRAILEEFDAKASRTEEILSDFTLREVTAATTTNATTTEESVGVE